MAAENRNISLIPFMHNCVVMRRGFFICWTGLCLGMATGVARGQDAVAQALYSVKAEPLSDIDSRLLLKARYQVQPDGAVLQPDISTPVTHADMPYIVQRLESSQRLQVLVQIDLILSKSQGEKNLTDAERESIRNLLRENWPILTRKSRKDFRAYFPLRELETMDQVPLPQASLVEQDLKDQEVQPVPIPAPPAPAVSAPPAANLPVAIPAAAMPQVQAAVESALALPVAAAATVSTGTTAVMASTVTVAAPITASTATPAALPPAMPGLGEVAAAEFERFLIEAPYGREGKAMLRLIAQYAPPFARRRVLNDLMTLFPRIALDPGRAGDHAYSRLIIGPDASASIVLTAGAILHEQRKFLGGSVMLLSRSSGAYAAAGLPAPGLQALQAEAAPTHNQNGAWGQASIYADGSQSVSFSVEAEAGYLLAELMRFDARLRGWDGSAYAVETVARDAQWLFYDALIAERRSDVFLDSETRDSYRQWLERPAEYYDDLLQSLTASRNGTVDPRKAGIAVVAEFDRQALVDCDKAAAAQASFRGLSARQARAGMLSDYEGSGLYEPERLSGARALPQTESGSAMTPGSCRTDLQSEIDALPKSEAVLKEAVAVERNWRRERGEAHAEKP